MPHAPLRPRGPHGFTLIEVMIVVAIIAILASIAIPSYRDYIIRGHLAEATSTLASYQAKMERHYQDNRTYATVTGTTTFTTPCAAGTDASRKIGQFQISCGTTAPTATAFTVQAAGVGSMANYTLRIDQEGVQSSTTPTAWGGNCATRWLLKRGMACPT